VVLLLCSSQRLVYGPDGTEIVGRFRQAAYIFFIDRLRGPHRPI